MESVPPSLRNETQTQSGGTAQEPRAQRESRNLKPGSLTLKFHMFSSNSHGFPPFHGTMSATPMCVPPLAAITHYHRFSSITQHKSIVPVRRSGGQWAWHFSHPRLSRWKSTCQRACAVLRQLEGPSAPRLICTLAASVPGGPALGPRPSSSRGLRASFASRSRGLPGVLVMLFLSSDPLSSQPSSLSGFLCCIFSLSSQTKLFAV